MNNDINRVRKALFLIILFFAPATLAGDVTLDLPLNGGFTVRNNDATIERFRIDEATGNILRNDFLFTHTTGGLFIGTNAGNLTMLGTNNTAFGNGALTNNLGVEGFFQSEAAENAAFGQRSLEANIQGGQNTAIGAFSMLFNENGRGNVAVGTFALSTQNAGIGNVAIGQNALRNVDGGIGNIGIGPQVGVSLTSGNNNIYLGAPGSIANESGQIRIGTDVFHQQTYIAGIFGKQVTGQIVIIDENGKLGSTSQVGGGAFDPALPLVLFENLAVGGTGFANVSLNVRARAGDDYLLNLFSANAISVFSVDKDGSFNSGGNSTVNGRASIGSPLFGNVSFVLKGQSGDAYLLDVYSSTNTNVFRVAENGNILAPAAGFTINNNGNVTASGNVTAGSFTTNGVSQLNGDVNVGDEVRANQLFINLEASVGTLTIRGGADIAEPFNVHEISRAKPGMVMAIDPDLPGQLRLSRQAYDTRVAGVVSGAGGINPGLLLTQENKEGVPIALTGRVYVWVDADEGGPVRPGDLLTSSSTEGHAMKVSDFSRSQGATLGKAMSSLNSGRGLVLVLVSL